MKWVLYVDLRSLTVLGRPTYSITIKPLGSTQPFNLNQVDFRLWCALDSGIDSALRLKWPQKVSNLYVTFFKSKRVYESE